MVVIGWHPGFTKKTPLKTTVNPVKNRRLQAAIGNNLVFRLLLGWLLPPKVAFLKLIQPEAMRLWYENMHVIQDMLVPVTTLAASLGVFRKHYDLYPLWVCPMKLMDVPGFIGPTDDEAFLLEA